MQFPMLFERFLDPTRTDPPDIDIDFEDDRGRGYSLMPQRSTAKSMLRTSVRLPLRLFQRVSVERLWRTARPDRGRRMGAADSLILCAGVRW